MSDSEVMTGAKPEAREVTQAEVDHYRENGWVKLDSLISGEAAGTVLSWLKERMGEDAGKAGGVPGLTMGGSSWFAKYQMPSRESDLFREFSHSPSIGAVGARLLGRSVRFWADTALIKRKDAESKTPWHQDVPNQPHDRRGLLTIWIALVDISPEKGSMRFLSKSTREGLLGRDLDVGATDEVYPHVLDRYEVSPPLTLKPGDATVHDGYIIHSAAPNATDEPRWAYSISLMDALTRYTGYPANWVADDRGITPGEHFEHESFPVVG